MTSPMYFEYTIFDIYERLSVYGRTHDSVADIIDPVYQLTMEQTSPFKEFFIYFFNQFFFAGRSLVGITAYRSVTSIRIQLPSGASD